LIMVNIKGVMTEIEGKFGKSESEAEIEN
jgi:hypothetical protein